MTHVMPAQAAPAPGPSPSPDQLVGLLRGRVAEALDGLVSVDDDAFVAAVMELECVANPGLVPTADGRWHSTPAAEGVADGR